MLNPWQLLASQLQELNLQGTELSHRVKVAAIGREKVCVYGVAARPRRRTTTFDLQGQGSLVRPDTTGLEREAV